MATHDYPLIDVIIISFNNGGLLEQNFPKIRANSYPSGKIRYIIVDNASVDNSADFAHAFPDVTLLRNERNLGFGGAINRGLAVATAEYVAILKDDVVPHPDWAREIMDTFRRHPSAGIIGSTIVERSGEVETVESAGTYFIPLYCWAGHTPVAAGLDECRKGPVQTIPYVDLGGCMIRRDALRSTGGISDRYLAYYEDIDTSFRLAGSGYEVLLAPGALLYDTRITPGHRRQSQAFYAYLRERNRFYILILFYPLPRLLISLPLAIVFGAGKGLAFLANGRLDAFGGTWKGLAAWCRVLPGLLRERRQLAAIRPQVTEHIYTSQQGQRGPNILLRRLAGFWGR